MKVEVRSPVPGIVEADITDKRGYATVSVGGRGLPNLRRHEAVDIALSAMAARGMDPVPSRDLHLSVASSGGDYVGWMRGKRGVSNGGWFVTLKVRA